ncbi:hypothetical protein ONS95_006846 [Cadophora gregata]|uniref:uncharacterized protein n=1 Tax=Cadophora gregata TaxID=51156 RepID=UPI0026DA9D4F|nr:uncharacterized protein ONS95_006846 [Cadophora gregata]KAK0101689.1 hypothetical protein ONS95_006846 [Cadophora gregata]
MLLVETTPLPYFPVLSFPHVLSFLLPSQILVSHHPLSKNVVRNKMSLLDLSTELLLNILSADRVLQRSDFHHILLTCKPLNAIALPGLYYTIRVRTPYARETDTRHLDRVIEHFRRHPDRLSWVHVARASCPQQDWVQSARMFGLLSSFPSVYGLFITAFGGWDEDTSFLHFAGICKRFQFLRDIELANPLVTIQDVL